MNERIAMLISAFGACWLLIPFLFFPSDSAGYFIHLAEAHGLDPNFFAFLFGMIDAAVIFGPWVYLATKGWLLSPVRARAYKRCRPPSRDKWS